jgi:DNA-binding NtrC family response regulator
MLVIEDNLSLLRTFGKIFEKNGYIVATVQTGKEAIEKLHCQKYDVALINYPLADMDMNQLFPEFTKLSPNAIKVLTSSEPNLPDNLEAASAFLEKPAEPEKLLCLIDSLLKLRDLEADSLA